MESFGETSAESFGEAPDGLAVGADILADTPAEAEENFEVVPEGVHAWLGQLSLRSEAQYGYGYPMPEPEPEPLAGLRWDRPTPRVGVWAEAQKLAETGQRAFWSMVLNVDVGDSDADKQNRQIPPLSGVL